MEFRRRVSEGLERRGWTLRQLCRAVAIDPSFFSKVLAGKRSPPEDEVLRRIAKELQLDATELIVSAGRIPSEWNRVNTDSELFRRVHAVVTGAPAPRPAPPRPSPVAARPPAPVSRPASAPSPAHRSSLAEELL